MGFRHHKHQNSKNFMVLDIDNTLISRPKYDRFDVESRSIDAITKILVNDLTGIKFDCNLIQNGLFLSNIESQTEISEGSLRFWAEIVQKLI